MTDDVRRRRWTDPDTGRVVPHPYEYSHTVAHYGHAFDYCWCRCPRTHEIHRIAA